MKLTDKLLDLMGRYESYLSGALLHEKQVTFEIVDVSLSCIPCKVAFYEHIVHKILKSASEQAMQGVHQ